LEQNGTNIHQKVYFIEENDGHQISKKKYPEGWGKLLASLFEIP
jgi:hypothetical protein